MVLEYIPPEYGRYNPGPVFSASGNIRSFRIYDGSYLPSEPILDWRTKPKYCRPWDGTREDAEHLCHLLNENRMILGEKGPQSEMTVTSKSQKIWRMNRSAKKRSMNPSSSRSGAKSSVTSSYTPGRFRKCVKCGRMTKKDS